MKLLPKVAAVLDATIRVCAVVAGVLVVAMMLLTTYEVVMRYFFHNAPTWAVEISEYMIFVITFLGAAWLLQLGGHVRVDFVVNRLNPKAQMLLNAATSALGATICLILTWYGGTTTWDYFQRGIGLIASLSFPKFILLGFIVLGFFLLTIRFLWQTYDHVAGWRTSVKADQEP